MGSDEGHEVKLNVSKALTKKLIALCADNIVEVATETANAMKSEVIEALKESAKLEVVEDE